MIFRAIAALCLGFLAGPAFAQFALVPTQPSEFDPVVVRLSVDSCVYDADSVSVRNESGVIRLYVGIRQCFAPGPLRIFDVGIGTYPTGLYRVEVVQVSGSTPGAIVASIPFSVTPRPTLAIFPPPKKALVDYSGNWMTPGESGWGLAIQHSPTQALFAQLFVYGTGSAPAWFTFQGGRWTSVTRWEGTVYASTGPAYGLAAFDPVAVTYLSVGTASIEFGALPIADGYATLTYSIGSTTVTKRIRRLVF